MSGTTDLERSSQDSGAKLILSLVAFVPHLRGPRLLSHSLCEYELLSVEPGFDELGRRSPTEG
jgi:hypothetical protein